jgi:transcriptional antiterminator NusG
MASVGKAQSKHTSTSDIDNGSEQIFLDSRVRWYIVQTYVGFEDAVKKSLDLKIRNLNLQDRIQEIFIPTRTVTKLNKKGERQDKIDRVYPGYIYIKMKLDKEIGYVIQNTSHISRIAGTGGVAVSLEDGYVERLKENLLLESEDNQKITATSFQLGDLITVIEGPFKDMTGKISGIDPANATVDVLLTMFERDTVVSLDVLAIRKVLQ